jgi:type II secretory pathway pseudopilin PulG
MFAVVILGIGFILIAAIFPVAVEQSRNTQDESIAAGLARDAIKTIQSATTSDDYPDTLGVMKPFADENGLWEKVCASAINTDNPRYAWVPFFFRNGNGPVQISVLVVRRWNQDAYTANDLAGDLQPRGVGIMSLSPSGEGTLMVRISRDEAGMYQCVTDGCFLILRSGEGNVAGKWFQVGHYKAEDSDSVFYTLVPGTGLTVDETIGTGTTAAVIGRGYTDPSNPAAGYSGPSQDIAVYSTVISPNQ